MNVQDANNAEQERVGEFLVRNEARIRLILWTRSGTMLRRYSSVDDLFQELCAEALDHASDLSDSDDDRAFVRRLSMLEYRVRMRATRRLRSWRQTVRIKQRSSKGSGIDSGVLPAGRRSPASSADCHMRYETVAEAICSLPRNYRDALILRHVEERPISEVAERLGKSVNAAAMDCRRALDELRKRLNSDDGR